ncbi:MAG: SRPBCC family protein [Candidatus Kariarchaeaceae archaeon]|jgi:hypothetical protein
MLIKDSIEINAPVDDVFQWFLNIEENYISWHQDHISCRWVKGHPFAVGSVMYIEELLHGKVHKMRFKTTKVIQNEYIQFSLGYPMAFICPRGSFSFHPRDDSCKFTSSLYFRFGWLLSRLMRRQKIAFEKHMKEEGIQLKHIFESNRSFSQ